MRLITFFISTVLVLAAEAQVITKVPLRGCLPAGFSRLVNVSSTTQLNAAFANALAGDQIRLATAVYSGGFSIAKSGTAALPITICGAPGAWPKITNGTFKIRGNFLNITGLLFEGPNASQNNIVIINVHDIYFSGNEVRNGDFHAGIAVDSTYNVEITNNYIHDNGLTDIDHGIYFRHQAGGGHIIANNVIVANRGRGISMHDNEGLPINNAVVVHNTIIGNGSTGILVATNGGSGNVIANNILANSGHIEGYNQITLRSGSGNLIYNNIVWSTLLARQGVGIESGVSGNLLSGNLALDPKFQGYASRDFHLLSGSPAIGLSRTEYAVNLDFEGYLRDLAADAGAYEAEAGLTPPPPEQTGIKKFVAAYDGYTNSKSLSVNYGAKVTLAIDQDNGKETTRAYLRFIVVGAGAIKKATLRLYVTGASANGPAVYATDNSWSENLLKWSNQPAPIGSALDDRGALAVGMWAEYNVTELVKADGTFNFVLMATSDDSIFFSSRESINKPELVVEY